MRPILVILLVASSAFAVPVAGTRGLVVSADPAASEIGARILRQGGTAADAVVAVAFALGVLEPWSSGIGGGGFLLYHQADSGSTSILDFREVAPRDARSELFAPQGTYLPQLSREGGLSVAVPGAVAGYAEARRRWGKLPLATLIEPAAKWAEQGFLVPPAYSAVVAFAEDLLERSPAAARVFLDKGARFPPGAKIVQRDLARTLRAIARKGPRAFYQGPIADAMVAAVRASGGVLSLRDLADYRVRERAPLRGTYRGFEVRTMPPPSAGGVTLLQMLNLLALAPPPQRDAYRAPAQIHLLVEGLKRAFADRAAWLGDPDFAPVPLPALLAPERAAAWLREIDPAHATPAKQIAPTREGTETTHICVIDAAGNVASMTTSINFLFGSGILAAGVLLGNTMDDFAAPAGANLYQLVGGARNAMAPGKVPLSTMAPTLVLGPAGKPVLVLGSSGGSRIATTLLQIAVHVLDEGMPVDLAVASPRLHHQHLPDQIFVEPFGMEAATREALVARGHVVIYDRMPWSSATAIQVDPVTGLRSGAGDPRRGGAAVAE